MTTITKPCTHCDGNGRVYRYAYGGRLEWTPCRHCHGNGVARDTTTTANLYDYRTGAFIRVATADELHASEQAAAVDGGHGIIEVEIDGAMVSCYCA